MREPVTGTVDNRAEIRDFLASRRARITPEQVGLPDQRAAPGPRAAARGGRRPRRREHRVVHAAGEGPHRRRLRGRPRRRRPGTAARRRRTHLPVRPGPSRAARPPRAVAPQGRRGPAPGPVAARLHDDVRGVRAQRPPGHRRQQRAGPGPARADVRQRDHGQHGRANIARYIFLDPGAADFFVDWEAAAIATAALLRAEAGREPHDRALRELIGELSTLSPEFRAQWAAHDVRIRHDGIKRLQPPRGRRPGADLPVPRPAHRQPGGARPDRLHRRTRQPSEDRLKLLASWAATQTAAPSPPTALAESPLPHELASTGTTTAARLGCPEAMPARCGSPGRGAHRHLDCKRVRQFLVLRSVRSCR